MCRQWPGKNFPLLPSLPPPLPPSPFHTHPPAPFSSLLPVGLIVEPHTCLSWRSNAESGLPGSGIGEVFTECTDSVSHAHSVVSCTTVRTDQLMQASHSLCDRQCALSGIDSVPSTSSFCRVSVRPGGMIYI